MCGIGWWFRPSGLVSWLTGSFLIRPGLEKWTGFWGTGMSPIRCAAPLSYSLGDVEIFRFSGWHCGVVEGFDAPSEAGTDYGNDRGEPVEEGEWGKGKG